MTSSHEMEQLYSYNPGWGISQKKETETSKTFAFLNSAFTF